MTRPPAGFFLDSLMSDCWLSEQHRVAELSYIHARILLVHIIMVRSLAL